MNTQDIINLISKYEEKPTPEVLLDLIDMLHNKMDALPISLKIKLMHLICKAYDYGNSYGIDEDIFTEYNGDLENIEWEDDLLPDILTQCILITKIEESSTEKKLWINEFYQLIEKLIDNSDNYTGFEEEHLKLLKFCAVNDNNDLCEAYVEFIELSDDDLDSDTTKCAYLYPFCHHNNYSNLYEVIAKSYSVYTQTGVVDRLNHILIDDLKQNFCKDPNSIDVGDVLTALEEMEHTQNNEAISVWCHHTVCYKNLSSKNDLSERLAEKVIKHYISNDLTLDVEDFRKTYQSPYITHRPLNVLKEELDRHNPKAEKLVDILLTKKSKKQFINNKRIAKTKNQNHTTSNNSVRKTSKRRQSRKKSPLKLIQSLLLPKRRSNSFNPKARNTKHLKENSLIWGKGGCATILLSFIGIALVVSLSIIYWNKFPDIVKSIIKWTGICIGVIIFFIIGEKTHKEY